MWTASFWKDAVERAIKTGAQFFAVTLGTNYMLMWDAGIYEILAATGSAMVLSLVTSIASSGIGEKGTASLVKAKPPLDETDIDSV
jgi:hypothetical protein